MNHGLGAAAAAPLALPSLELQPTQSPRVYRIIFTLTQNLRWAVGIAVMQVLWVVAYLVVDGEAFILAFFALIAPSFSQALIRIDEGEYGYCEETGEEIGLKRLEARPVATLCLEAQERRELAERQFRDRDDRYR